MTIWTYKVTKGKFKGKTVYTFTNTLFIPPNVPIGTFDDEGNEYLLFQDGLSFVSVEEKEDPDYETAKANGFMGTYEDYQECLKNFM